MKPSSFSTICTSNCAFELCGLLLSLSVFHPDEKIYILSDTKTKKYMDELTPSPKLDIVWFIELDMYDNMNTEQMKSKGLWSDFQMKKAEIISYALKSESDTLFLDSDIIVTDTIDDIDNTKDIGVSPQLINLEDQKKYGFYNGGMLWTRSKQVPNDWIEFTKESRYYDQASIENLVDKYSYFEFGDNYNLQTWRYILSPEGSDKIASYISHANGIVHYKDKPLKCIHTHLRNGLFNKFNQILINHFSEAKMYKILAIVFRVINGKWVLRIPKQPMTGLGYHKNDSYRELPYLMKIRNNDVEVIEDDNTVHCWIMPNILTYDRPILDRCVVEVNNASLFLLGNGDINVEGNQLRQAFSKLPIKPWIFWPRAPKLLEQLLETNGILSYNDREHKSIFIGNYECKEQADFRDTNTRWDNVIDKYHCTKGKTYLFTHEEYLLNLRNSKFGLCLRGYGTKCHREVELMAFGTVLIVTPKVSVSSFLEPLIEGTHYIYVTSPNEIKEKLEAITEEKWNQMSKSCYEWYQRNVHSKNCWKNMISKILYE